MTEIALRYDPDRGLHDIVLNGPDLATDRDLATAVLVSLFSDARADAAEILPDPDSEDRRGWWADAYLTKPDGGPGWGSGLWLLVREVVTADTLERARRYAKAALEWIVADGVAARVEVAVWRQDLNAVGLGITITRHDGTVQAPRFAGAWDQLSRPAD